MKLDEFALEQYKSLRDEVLKRLDLQSQLLTLTLVAAGTLISLIAISPFATLVYPILAMFIAAGWIYHSVTIGQINRFLRSNVAGDDLMWENYQLIGIGWQMNWIFGSFSVGGLFIGTQLLTILLVYLQYHLSLPEIIFFGIDIASLIITGSMFVFTYFIRQAWAAKSRKKFKSVVLK